MRIMGRPVHRAGAAFAVVASAVLLAGCGSGPSQVGAAVIVGNHSVSEDEVQSLIAKAVQQQPYAQQLAAEHKLDQLGREVVSQLVQHELAQRAMADEHLTVDEGKIQQALAKVPLDQKVAANPQDPQSALSAVVASVRDHHEALVDQSIELQLVAKYFPKLSVTFDYLPIGGGTPSDGSAPTMSPQVARQQAFAKVREFAANPAAATKAILQAQQQAQQSQQAQQQDPSQPVPQVSFTKKVFSAVGDPGDTGTALYGSAPNSVIAFQLPEDQSWIVAVVHRRDADKVQPTEQAAEPTSAQLEKMGVRFLQPYYDKVAPRINPRYGIWDVGSMGVVANADALTGLVLPLQGSPASQQ